MSYAGRDSRERLRAAAGVAAVHAALGYALLTGLGFDPALKAADSLKLIDIMELPPPPLSDPPEPEEARKDTRKPRDPEGAASPPNLEDKPVELVAPKPVVPQPTPPMVVAPIASQGNRQRAGAAPVPGPGTGAGGVGQGLGSGLSGSGTGGGGGGGIARPARWIAGDIRESDYPREALRARQQGTVYMRFTVAPNGRVSDCQVTRSSGSRALDVTTCRLIMRRFRYQPARDTAGRPVAEVIRGEQLWELAPEKPDRWIEGEWVEE